MPDPILRTPREATDRLRGSRRGRNVGSRREKSVKGKSDGRLKRLRKWAYTNRYELADWGISVAAVVAMCAVEYYKSPVQQTTDDNAQLISGMPAADDALGWQMHREIHELTKTGMSLDRAYRKLSLRYHQDKGKTRLPNNEEFHALTAAHTFLTQMNKLEEMCKKH
jgi:hypothetical protein